MSEDIPSAMLERRREMLLLGLEMEEAGCEMPEWWPSAKALSIQSLERKKAPGPEGAEALG